MPVTVAPLRGGRRSQVQPAPAVDRGGGHRGYPGRMSDWPLSYQESGAGQG
jgi:hypothetical protein